MTDTPSTPEATPETDLPAEDDYRSFDWEDAVVRRGYGGLGKPEVFNRSTGEFAVFLDFDWREAEPIDEAQAKEMMGAEDDTAPEDSAEDKAEDKTEDKGEGQDGD